MFEIHIGDTPNKLAPKDFRTLADRTDRYSGSDISTVVRDALMQPIRKVMSATHFKHVVDPHSEKPEPTKWTPCSPGDPDGVEKTWQEVESDELLEPPLKLGDFLLSLEATPRTVTEADIKRNEDWTKDSGEYLVILACLQY
jgi:vacuolar protein-sorting-associated protein 4